MSAFLQVQSLRKEHPGSGEAGSLVVFDDISFNIPRGEFACIIEYSGCGRTTILNVLAGLEQPAGGHVFVDGREVSGPSLDRGMVFQSHALLPWLSVWGNIPFAVKSRWPHWSKSQVAGQVRKYIELVHLQGAERRKPAQLSGGMKQRVGIARAFAIQPKMLLLDEPFGALDALARGNIQDELVEIVRQTQQTCLWSLTTWMRRSFLPTESF